MADFRAIAPPQYVFTPDGSTVRVFGWWSNDGWETVHPFVGNPDGYGAGPWFRFYGEDVWELK